MIEPIGGSQRPTTTPFSSLFKTSAVLRIGAGVVLMSRHAWDALPAAYQFIWHEQPWAWKIAFEEAGVPYPHLLAPATALALFAIAASWITGFLTRLFAVLFLPIGALALMFAKADHPAFSESCWLYLLIAFTLMLFGSGAISLDQLFKFGENRKQPVQRY